MKKFTKLTVLSAISAATILVSLDATFADTTFIHNENIMERIGSNFPSHDFGIHSNIHHNPHVEHKRREYNQYRVERKTHHYVEREKTTQRHIHHHHVSPNKSGDALTAGIVGLAAGAILGNVLKQPEQPQVVYQSIQHPQVVYQEVPQNRVIYEVQQTTTYQPVQQTQTARWLQYCQKKYRSFNPNTGTFRGNDGLEHFCYAPLN
ncbi:BA14K family protein [Bartonella sp. CB169]|uniref:BA14K family protein n=1 Tax=Bartonella sp. CB169 TaxID=3112257 RepID=UPI00300E3F69